MSDRTRPAGRRIPLRGLVRGAAGGATAQARRMCQAASGVAHPSHSSSESSRLTRTTQAEVPPRKNPPSGSLLASKSVLRCSAAVRSPALSLFKLRRTRRDTSAGRPQPVAHPVTSAPRALTRMPGVGGSASVPDSRAREREWRFRPRIWPGPAGPRVWREAFRARSTRPHSRGKEDAARPGPGRVRRAR